MSPSVRLLAMLLVLIIPAVLWPQAKTPASPTKLPDGVYAVQRDSLQEKDVRPLKEGELLLIDHHRYVKGSEKEPARFLVVRSVPEVRLDLTSEPKVVKEGT